MQVTDGLSVTSASTSGLSHELSLSAVHTGGDHDARVNLMLAQNPNATKELCDRCVAAEEDVIGNLTAVKDALLDLSAAQKNLTDAEEAHSQCVAQTEPYTKADNDAKAAVRDEMDILTRLKENVQKYLDEDKPNRIVAEAGTSCVVDGLLDEARTWVAAWNALNTKLAECQGLYYDVTNATAAVTFMNTSLHEAEQAGIAANLTAVAECDAMRAAGYTGAAYRFITSGHCLDIGYERITSTAQCQAAMDFLGYQDNDGVIADMGRNTGRPLGCTFHPAGNAELWGSGSSMSLACGSWGYAGCFCALPGQ